jgi:histone-lysine N-methyltransferase MLL3
MTGDETKLMTCEQCDKIYHSTCQRPIVTSIPKYGWKCRCCRVCGDCGSRTPGAGLSSRWHSHYTVCDSCYQQRNKGFSCPLCHRAYRAHAHREMVQCTLCRKFVHGTCDPEADLVTYHQRKESHPEYEYVCLMCKNLTQPAGLLSKRNSEYCYPNTSIFT